MGKKDGKKVDKEKLEAKKIRQAAKQQKTTSKRVKKEVKESGEDDIEAIIAEFSAKDAARVAVTISTSEQPSPRANFSMTALPNGEMLLFGGEFCDGEGTEVYNNLYRWNMDKSEWKHIESLNTPPPRCSHQSVYYKEKIYVFGGEYATLDQFHHYRDFWELDLKTSTWTEIKAVGDAPNARSGHRMVIWRNFLVLFGGFYEAMREVRWYNDLYLYSFQDRRWIQIPNKANCQVPKPRSGVQMCVHSVDDCVYIYGGYSKEKVTGSKKEGKVHEDMWCLNLKPILVSSGSAASGKGSGISSIDTSKATWQKITRKGDYPSARCGSGMTMYKNKALLFGGVYDDEGPRHSLISTFYNDLFAFDMERRRWYKLGLKQKKLKVKLTSADKKAKKAARIASKADKASTKEGEEGEDDNNDEEEENDEEDDDDESSDDEDENDGIVSKSALDATKGGEFFGYIDESGTVVYINMNDEDDTAEEGVGETTNNAVQSVSADINNMKISADGGDVETVFNQPVVEATSSQSDSMVVDSTDGNKATPSASDIRLAESLRNQEKYSKGNGRNNNKDKDTLAEYLNLSGGEDGEALTEEQKKQAAESAAAKAASQSYISKYFSEQTVPCTRINPCMLIRGNTLYIYGGVTELGDVEVTLDDCWSLDLNKRDNWKKVLNGTMHTLVWKGQEDDDGTSSHYSGVGSGSDDDSDDDDDDDDSDDDDDDDDVRVSNKSSKRSSSKISPDPTDKTKSTTKSKSKSSSGGSSNSKGGLRAEMEGLRSHFDMTDSNRTPLSDETLRQFYSRTTEYWATVVIAQWHANQEQAALNGTINKNETLSEKEIKRQGFLQAEVRYNELLPLLARLNELELQQKEEEEYASRRDAKGGKSSGKGSSKNR